MSSRALGPVLALLMLVPPGTCTCQAHAHCDAAPTVNLAPDGDAADRPSPCSGASDRDRPSDRGHAPFCPAAESPALRAAVREVQATPILPPAPAPAVPAADAPPGPAARPAPPLELPGEPPPLYLRLCTLRI